MYFFFKYLLDCIEEGKRSLDIVINKLNHTICVELSQIVKNPLSIVQNKGHLEIARICQRS